MIRSRATMSPPRSTPGRVTLSVPSRRLAVRGRRRPRRAARPAGHRDPVVRRDASATRPVPVPGDDCTAPETTFTGTPPSTTSPRPSPATRRSGSPRSQPERRRDLRVQARGSLAGSRLGRLHDTAGAGRDDSTGSRSYDGLALGQLHVLGPGDRRRQLGTTNTEQTPATFSWTIVEPEGPPPPDTEDPDTVITNGADRWHPFSYLGITYAADEHAGRFRCTLNGQERSCGRRAGELLGMKAGDYLFTVAASTTPGTSTPPRRRSAGRSR